MSISRHLCFVPVATLALLAVGCDDSPAPAPGEATEQPTVPSATVTAAEPAAQEETPAAASPEPSGSPVAEQPEELTPEQTEAAVASAEAAEQTQEPEAEQDTAAAEDAADADGGVDEALMEDEDAELEVPTVLAPSPHKVFEHWHEVLMSQSTPEMVYSYRKGEPLDESELEEVAEIRGKCLIALEAGKALYTARLALIEGALSLPDLSMEEEEKEQKLEDCRTWLAEGFRRDLEAQCFSEGWMDAGCVEPSSRPGRQELLFRTVQETLALEQVDGCTADIGWGYSAVNEVWEQRLDDLMKRLSERYRDGNQALWGIDRAEPLTDSFWKLDDNDEKTPETARFCTMMQERIREEHAAWLLYKRAMSELLCPSLGFQGSGSGIMMTNYESHLLDSRERFICLLTVGINKAATLPGLEVDRQAELLPLHTAHPFGEIFTCWATLFRHPKLEGNPWCIRFDGQGAGFIFAKEDKILRSYIAKYPQGGRAEVSGYQTIEQTGTPYEKPKNQNSYRYEEDEDTPHPLPANALQLRQVFHLQACTPESEY